MNRRHFLRYSLAAGTALAGFSSQGCGRDMRARLVVEPKEAAGLTREEAAILFYAALAPSGHNSQPWAVRKERDLQWVIGSDRSRWLAQVDPDNREVMLSIGAFMENLVLAARAFGYEARIDILARAAFDSDVARVRLLPGKNTKDGTSRTLDLIRRRRTVKTGLQAEVLKAMDLKALESAAGGGLYSFPRGTRHAALMAEAAVENFRLQFENDRAMAEAARWTRLSDREAERFRDGLTPDGMEIQGFSGWWVRNVMDSRDVTGAMWREKALEKAMVQAHEGAGWLVLTSPGEGVADLLSAGRRFQRLALAATDLGIGIHPMTQTLEEGHGRQQIRENHAPSMMPQFMLRAGYVRPYPAPVSLRRPVSWFVTG